jgi:SAM-dependent methyltransferase
VSSSRLHRAAKAAKRAASTRTLVRWGSFRRTTPISDNFGWDRGQPVDRFYIERFFARFAQDVRGDVLEVMEPLYTDRFGGDRVRRRHVVDVDPANPRATVVADLGQAGSLGEEQFDCVILTQTLQFIREPATALGNVWASLRRGGVLLVSVPCLQRLEPDLAAADRWRILPAGLTQLLAEACAGAELEAAGFGNALAAIAFVMGLAAEELNQSELEIQDEHFPIVACARAKKPAA